MSSDRPDVASLREYLRKPGFGGTDYDLSDDELARYIEAAKERVGSRRLSWHELALDAIEADHDAS